MTFGLIIFTLVHFSTWFLSNLARFFGYSGCSQLFTEIITHSTVYLLDYVKILALFSRSRFVCQTAKCGFLIYKNMNQLTRKNLWFSCCWVSLVTSGRRGTLQHHPFVFALPILSQKLTYSLYLLIFLLTEENMVGFNKHKIYQLRFQFRNKLRKFIWCFESPYFSKVKVISRIKNSVSVFSPLLFWIMFLCLSVVRASLGNTSRREDC